MPTLNRYRIWCSTENIYTYIWNDSIPTVCPNNNGHTIDSNLISIIDTLSDNQVTITGTGPTGTPSVGKLDGVAFTTTTPLTSTQLFSSGVLDARGYTQLQTHITSDVSGTILVDFSSDPAGSNIVRQLTIPYVGGSGFQLFASPVFSDYIIYKFQNGNLTQTDFLYETKFLTKSLNAQILETESFISSNMSTALNRSVIVAKSSDNVYKNINSDASGNLLVSLGRENLTAFGEVKVSNYKPIIQELFQYNINSRFINTSTTLGGTLTSQNSLAVCSSSTTLNSIALLQTRKKVKYRPGEGVMVRFTASFTSDVYTSIQYIGLIDSTDGFAFGYKDGEFSILHRNSASGSISDTWIPQSSWNNDKANGTTTLQQIDFTNINVYQIQFQYLGAGAIIFSIEDPNRGSFINVHTIQYANSNTIVSLNNPILPCSIYSSNGNTPTDCIVKCGSLAAFIEGSSGGLGILNNQSTHKIIGTTHTNVLTIRNRSIFNGKTNKSIIFPQALNVAANGFAKPVYITISLNSTLGGSPSYTNYNTDNSIVEYDTDGTTLSNSTIIESFYISKDGCDRIEFFHTPDFFVDTGETLTIAASTTAANGEFSISLTWLEDI